MNERKIERILITGSSGTVGTRLFESLLERGFDVTGADWRENRWCPELNKKTLSVDLRDREAVLKNLPENTDMVVHLAANARVHNLVQDPSLALDNLITLFNVTDYVRLRSIPRLIFASSREVYGEVVDEPYGEGEIILENCENPYAASKVGGEAMIHSFANCFKIGYVIVRLSNVYGMYDNSDRVIPLFIRNCLQGSNLQVFGREKLLDFIHIDDAIHGVGLCIDNFDALRGGIFNISSGTGTSILGLAERICAETGASIKIDVKDNRPGEVMRFVSAIDKARTRLGFEPKIGIGAGIARSVTWYRNFYATSGA